ncbi:MAG: hypothetical protein ACRDRN_14915 [Sciscionella sp.]
MSTEQSVPYTGTAAFDPLSRERSRAARTVARNALDNTDLAELLEMLDLAAKGDP